MKKKITFLFFICVFLLFFKTLTISVLGYVSGGVYINKNFGIYDVTSQNFNDISCNIEKGEYVYTVTDSAWNDGKNPVITIDLSEYGIDSQEIYRKIYKTIVIIFQMTLREDSDGYQEIYLINTNTNNYLSNPITDFQHGGNKLSREYERYEFYAEIPIERFTSTSFSLAFSAHGFASDNWKFGNVRVQVCGSYEKCKINNIRHVVNATTDSSLWCNNLLNPGN